MQHIEIQTGVIRPVECFREGWELIKGQYWLLFAITIVGGLIGGLSFYILLGSMVCGIFYCYFRVMDGEKAEIENLFRGFSYFWPSLLVTIVIVVPMVLIFALIYVPLLIATFMGERMSQDEFFNILSGTLLVEFVVALVMICLHTLLMFSFPLIVDRGLSGWGAMVLSAKAVWRNLGGVTGLWALGFVVSMIGYLALCVGLYFTIPLVIAGNIVAFRKVFPKDPARGDLPPAPERYFGSGGGI